VPVRPIGGLRPGGLQGGHDLRYIALNGAIADGDDILRTVVSAASRAHGEAHAEQSHREDPCDSAATHLVSLQGRLRGLQADVPWTPPTTSGWCRGVDAAEAPSCTVGPPDIYCSRVHCTTPPYQNSRKN
jgi:hypothetical protein